jgi:hypothetical protein
VRDDENYYRGLLESAHKGFENAKAFLEAAGNSEAAKQLEHDADQLWDHFKRVLRGD